MSDPDSSISDFAQKLLERAKVRKEVVGGNLHKGMQDIESPQSSNTANVSQVPTPIPQPEKCLKEVQLPNILTGDLDISDPGVSYEEEDIKKDSMSAGRRTRLKSLANRINQWEDDMTHYVPPSSRFNISPPKSCTPPATRSSTVDVPKLKAPVPVATKKDETSTPNISVFHAPVALATKKKETSMLNVPNIKAQASTTTKENESSTMGKFKIPAAAKTTDAKGGPKLQLNSTLPTTGLSVAQRAKMFEQQSTGNVPKPFQSPAASRQFTHIKKGALLAKPPGRVQFAASNPHDISISIPRGKVENQRRLFEGGQDGDLMEHEEMEEETSSALDISVSADSSPPPLSACISPPSLPPQQMDLDLSLTFSALVDDTLQTQVSPSLKTTGSKPWSRSGSPRKDSLAPRGKSTTPKRAASPSHSRSTSPDKKNYPGARDVKRIRVNEPKEGRMYPSLTDIESQTETETELEPETDTEGESVEDDRTILGVSECSSLGAQVERMAKGHNGTEDESPAAQFGITLQTPKRNRYYRPTEDFSASLACREIDAMIDDALEGQSFSMDTVMEGGLCSVIASSTPISSTLIGGSSPSVSVPAATIPGADHGLVEDEEGDESTLEGKSDNTTSIMPSESEAQSGQESYEQSIMFTHSRYDLDTNTPNKNSSPLDTSSPLCPKRQGVSSSPSFTGSSLVHTVSFFRKQQEELCVTPRKTGHSSEKLTVTEDGGPQLTDHQTTTYVNAINDVIKKLEEELATQLRSIGQVSKALTLCKSTLEFSESTENVECEKVLLIACQKRNAISNEITRLRTEGALSKMPFITASKNDLGPSCHGKLSISEMTVELKQDFIRSKVLVGKSVYHFIVLLKERQHVEVSSLVSIGNGRNNAKVLDTDGCLHFPNTFTLENLDPGFKAELEVFVLETQKEFLPHETKYHIFKKQKESKGLTPKKKAESKFSRVYQPSPAGPDAVLTPNFKICGRLTINISALGGRGHGGFWNMDGVRFDSPVEGSVSLKIQCSAEGGEEKTGFLTLFDEVSGMGVWNRRWAKLTANHLTFWMYPEDDQEGSNPQEQIPLRHCVTTRVCPVQRDVCARANTFRLVTTRDPLPDDKASIITSCHTKKTAIRHLLSADTREERDAWCANLNRALANLRAWDPQAASPDDTLF